MGNNIKYYKTPYSDELEEEEIGINWCCSELQSLFNQFSSPLKREGKGEWKINFAYWYPDNERWGNNWETIKFCFLCGRSLEER